MHTAVEAWAARASATLSALVQAKFTPEERLAAEEQFPLRSWNVKTDGKLAHVYCLVPIEQLCQYDAERRMIALRTDATELLQRNMNDRKSILVLPTLAFLLHPDHAHDVVCPPFDVAGAVAAREWTAVTKARKVLLVRVNVLGIVGQRPLLGGVDTERTPSLQWKEERKEGGLDGDGAAAAAAGVITLPLMCATKVELAASSVHASLVTSMPSRVDTLGSMMRFMHTQCWLK